MNLIPWPHTVRAGSRMSRLHDGGSLFAGLFNDPFFGPSVPSTGVGAPLDVVETETGYTVTAEIPGVKPEDVEVAVDGNLLTISGEKRSAEESEDVRAHHVERRFGAFRRTIRLPDTVDRDKVEAEHADGVVTVRLPKSESAQPRRIQVKSPQR